MFAMAGRPPNAVADEEEESSDEEASTTSEIKSKRCQIGESTVIGTDGREYGESMVVTTHGLRFGTG